MKIIEIEVFVPNSRAPDDSTYHTIPFNLEHLIFAYPNLGEYQWEAKSILHLTDGRTLICKSHGLEDFVEKKTIPSEFY